MDTLIQWFIKERFDNANFSSWLGAFNYYVLRWASYKLARVEHTTSGKHLGFKLIANVDCGWKD
jgi:hypothetical protein